MWVTVPDPDGVEYVSSPEVQLARAESQNGFLKGDCDDAATLGAALLFTMGYPCWLVAIRLYTDLEFSHVFLRCPDPASLYGTRPRQLDIDPIVPESELPIKGFTEKMEVLI